MQYWGTILGMFFGYFLIGPVGVCVGLIIGYYFDKGIWLQQKKGADTVDEQLRRPYFIYAIFSTLGHLSKSKGWIAKSDIQRAQNLMVQLALNQEQQRLAQQAFLQGKQAEFSLHRTLNSFRQACGAQDKLMAIFMEIQLKTAFVYGIPHPHERELLCRIAEELNISRLELQRLFAILEGFDPFDNYADQYRRTKYTHHNQYYDEPQKSNQLTLKQACQILGVNDYDDNAKIKRAYRKLMIRHHPDKLISKELSPAIMEKNKQEAQKIQAAYEYIKKYKNFK